jgi:hypothetical protein
MIAQCLRRWCGVGRCHGLSGGRAGRLPVAGERVAGKGADNTPCRGGFRLLSRQGRFPRLLSRETVSLERLKEIQSHLNLLQRSYQKPLNRVGVSIGAYRSEGWGPGMASKPPTVSRGGPLARGPFLLWLGQGSRRFKADGLYLAGTGTPVRLG